MMHDPTCCQTVTVYRLRQGEVFRKVLYDCYYHYKDVVDGNRFERKFTLITPDTEPVCAGDRIYDGIGPETVCWEEFLPVNVPGLSQAEYAEPWIFLGQIRHWEAGR